MRYLVLMYQDEQVWADATSEQQQQVMAAHDAFDKAVRNQASLVAGEALASEGETTTLRHEQGRPVLTDGPFAESVEQLGGFYLVDADDLDTMLALAKLLPHDYTVEIRATVDIG